ncbi:hypothetical protein [Stenotrophomonas pictorum]|nr:hypothetical protein [Stenotrophomonas pictorum]
MNMNPRSVTLNVHVFVAVASYLACFFFPAIYVGGNFEPQSSLGLLLMGWAAALELNFGWFANPAFLIAAFLAQKKPRASAILAVVALALALSFPLYRHVRVHEISSQSPVSAYGWGYALWVMSMALLAAGQFARLRLGRESLVLLAALSAGGMVAMMYGIYGASGSGGLQAHAKERDRVFDASCVTAGMQVVRRAKDVRSVFLAPDWSWTIAPRGSRASKLKYRTYGAIMRNGLLRSGKLDFVVTTAPEGQQGYFQFTPDNMDGITVPQPQGRYAVLTRARDFPWPLGLQGETIEIKDRGDGSLLASASYVLDTQSGRYCGPPGNTFSAQAFAAEVLGL